MTKDIKARVSIITVVLNDVTGIEKTIKSVIDQDYDHLEYIVIDGGSVDGTVDVIKKNLDRIDFFISETDKGIYDAMNKGAKQARGEYIYFLNSSDVLYKTTVISKLIKYFERGYDLIAGVVIILYPYYKVFSRPSIKGLRWGKMPPHQGAFIRKELFDKLNGFNVKYKSSGDYDFFCKLLEAESSSITVSEVVAYMPSGGFSSQKKISLSEKASIIKARFGLLYFMIFVFHKMILEQGIKKVLLTIGLKRIYARLLKIKLRGVD